MKIRLVFILCILCFFMITNVRAEFYYDINLKYNSGNLSINSVNIIFSQYELTNEYYNETSAYTIQIDSDKQVKFNVNNIQIYDKMDNTGELSGGIIYMNNFDFDVFIPYEDAKEILILKNQTEMNKKSLLEFSRNYNKEEYNQINNLINESLNENISENETSSSENINQIIKNNVLYILIVCVVLILVIVIYFIFKKKK